MANKAKSPHASFITILGDILTASSQSEDEAKRMGVQWRNDGTGFCIIDVRC
jgi:hypothetical protein